MAEESKWLDWAMELQAIAQSGLHYEQNIFQIERFERIREIAAEMIAHKSEIPVDKVKDLFCNETGYQTPKLDTRAAIFKDDKILLVQEQSGRWALPGGWVDAQLSIAENTIKEAWEEAGLEVRPDFVIAIQDRDKHNEPRYAYKIIKVFMMCTALGGSFQPNTETLASDYFSLDDLPDLALGKTNFDQLRMCFEAYHAEQWTTQFD